MGIGFHCIAAELRWYYLHRKAGAGEVGEVLARSRVDNTLGTNKEVAQIFARGDTPVREEDKSQL